MKYWRTMRAFVVGYLGLSALGAIIAAIATGSLAAVGVAAASCTIAAFAWFMFQKAMDAFAAAVGRSRATLDALATRGMDSPKSPVQEKWDASVAQTFLGSRHTLSWTNMGSGLTLDATHDGARWQFASYVQPTRNSPMYLVSSYARVELGGANIPFKIARQGVGGRLAAALGAPTDAQIGDETFDKTFALTGDAALLREVLDERTRRELLALSDAASGSYFNLDLEVVGESLVLHWPGELDVLLAMRLRDFMGHLRARLLEALARRAVTGVRVGGFRSMGETAAQSEVAVESPAQEGSSRR